MSSNKFTISGGNVAGSNVSAGDNNQLNVSSAAGAAATETDVLTALRAARADLVAGGGSAQDRQGIADEINKILATIEGGQASPAAVRSRWGVVQALLGAGAAMGTALAETAGKITDLITSVFGA